MFNKPLAFFSFGAILQMVLGSSIDIYYPKTNTVATTGSTMHIKWHVKDKSVGPIRLQYASGKPTSLNINGIIAENIDASLGSYAWKIPNDLKAKKYVIEAGPSASDLSFVGYITIKKGHKKHTTKKHTTKKHTTKKHTKKHSTKKVSDKKSASPSAVCVGYPSNENKSEKVRCHSVPKHRAIKQYRKSTKKTFRKKSSKKGSSKKTTTQA